MGDEGSPNYLSSATPEIGSEPGTPENLLDLVAIRSPDDVFPLSSIPGGVSPTRSD